MSARPSSTAACTSLTNTPWPPRDEIGASVRRSPTVSTTTGSTSTGEQRRHQVGLGEGQRAPPCRRAPRPCHLPIVGHRSKSSRRASERRSPRAEPGRLLEPDRGLVEQLVHEAPGDRRDGLLLLGVEAVEAAAVAVELGQPELLGPVAQGRHRGGHLALGGGVDEAHDLVGHDAADLADLLEPLVDAHLHERPQVGEVEQGDAGEQAHRQGRRRGACPCRRSGGAPRPAARRRRRGRRR